MIVCDPNKAMDIVEWSICEGGRLDRFNYIYIYTTPYIYTHIYRVWYIYIVESIYIYIYEERSPKTCLNAIPQKGFPMSMPSAEVMFWGRALRKCVNVYVYLHI